MQVDNYKKNTGIFFLGLLLMFAFQTLSAQFIPTTVIRSNNIIKLSGQHYYLHEVKGGQTLYSISKAYGVSPKNIANENPIIQLGKIKEGQVLRIPYIEITEPFIDELKNHELYIYHIVEPKQTLSSLSRQYNIPVQDLIKLNPGVEVVLSIGKELKIPRTQLNTVRDIYIPDEIGNFRFHKVADKETIFSLSRQYGIKVSEIKKANPELRWGLSIGEIIRIPMESGLTIDSTSNEVKEIIRDSHEREHNLRSFTQQMQDSTRHDYLITANPEIFLKNKPTGECGSYIRLHDDTHFEIAFLLPLFVTANDTLHLNDSIPYPENDMYREALRFLEFMEGALLAIDSLRQSGLSMNVHIYDTERDPNVVRDLVMSGQLNNLDLIFGPVYPEPLEIASIFSRMRRIPLVSPLSSRGIGIEDNPYLFQVNPTEQLQHDLASIYLSRFYDKNILLVKDTNDLNTMTNRYSSNIRNYLTYKINASDLRYRQILFTDKDRAISMDDSLAFRLEDVLSLNRQNLIIIPSTNKVFVADMINRLNNLSLHYDITTFGKPQWGQFDALQLESLYNLNLHYYTNFSNPYVNYSDPLTLSMCKKYRRNFNNEPNRFSFQGFDISYYFIKALYLFGTDFTRYVDCWPEVLNHPTLQTSFHFVRKSEHGGYENQALSIVRYNQQSLEKEKISSTTPMSQELQP